MGDARLAPVARCLGGFQHPLGRTIDFGVSAPNASTAGETGRNPKAVAASWGVAASSAMAGGRIRRRDLAAEHVERRRDELQRLFPEATIVLQSEVISDENIERERRIQQALSEPTRFEFANASLQDAIDYLSDLHNVDIRLDAQALENAQIDSEIPLTFQAQDIPLGKALANLLAPLKLTFVVRQAVVTITTQTVAQGSNKSPYGDFSD